jgi:hypothetical protein
MGYSSDPSLYPPEFQELFSRAIDSPVEINLPYPQQAIQLRHQLHAYRRAVESAKIPGWTDLRQITIQINKSKLTMANNSELRLAMQKAINDTTSTEPTDTELDQYIKEMERGDDND